MHDRKPEWEIALEQQVKIARAEVSRLTALLQHPTPQQSRLWKRYQLPDIDSVRQLLEVQKAQLLALAARRRRRKEEENTRKLRELFQRNERQFYRNLRSGMKGETNPGSTGQLPEKDVTQHFWEQILSTPVDFAPGRWLARQHSDATGAINPQAEPMITPEVLKRALDRTRLWGAAGNDEVQGYWIRKLTSLHDYISAAFSDIVCGDSGIPMWMVDGRTVLIPKTGQATPDPSNYRPITCLPVVYKTLTSCLNILMREHIEDNHILASEQRGCSPGSKGCTEQLLINAMICDDVRARKRNLFIAWIDFRKAFDSLSHGCIVEMLKLYRFHPSIIGFIERSMAKWSTTMTASTVTTKVTTDRIPIRRGIFQGDSLSPLLFCLCLNIISTELSHSGMGYVMSIADVKHILSHLWFMDDLKLYAGTRNQLTSMVATVETMGLQMGLHFGLTKCASATVIRGCLQDAAGIPTSQQSIIESLKNGQHYKYLGMAELQGTLHEQAKAASIKEYTSRVVKILDTPLCAKDAVKAINTYAVPVMLYGFGVVKWTKMELEASDRIVRKLLTQRGMHHPNKINTARYAATTTPPQSRQKPELLCHEIGKGVPGRDWLLGRGKAVPHTKRSNEEEERGQEERQSTRDAAAWSVLETVGGEGVRTAIYKQWLAFLSQFEINHRGTGICCPGPGHPHSQLRIRCDENQKEKRRHVQAVREGLGDSRSPSFRVSGLGERLLQHQA